MRPAGQARRHGLQLRGAVALRGEDPAGSGEVDVQPLRWAAGGGARGGQGAEQGKASVGVAHSVRCVRARARRARS